MRGRRPVCSTNAWLHSEDEIDLQMHMDEIGKRFEKSRERYLDTRVLNEEMFELLAAEDDDAEEDA